MRDLSLSPMGARLRVLRAAERGELLARGHQRQTRLEPGELAAWRLKMRDRDLDAEDAKEAREDRDAREARGAREEAA